MSAAVEQMTGRSGGRVLQPPPPRGELSERLIATLTSGPPDARIEPLCRGADIDQDPLADDDLQLALYLCYELHYADIEGVDARWEWAPALLAFRASLEHPFLEAARELAGEPSAQECSDVPRALRELLKAEEGPSLSRTLRTSGTREQLRELAVHRSAYQLKEADPHSWLIPRLTGGPKAALLEIQFDEYGGARAERMHCALFARAMRAQGLEDSYGAYLELIPGVTLANVNLMSCLGLHRRLAPALVGQLAAFEMTSAIPNRRYGDALRRLGYGADATAFYDEHVEADSVHEEIAAWELAGGLARQDPACAHEILFGARALLALEERWATHLLERWAAGQGSLLGSLPSSPG
jgi:hypothetical protein